MTANSPPKRLADRYQLRDLIGEGGFAKVYLGYDERLDRQVAVKLLHSERISNIIDTQRFLREAQTAARLQHSVLVQMYDLGEQGQFSLLM